MTRLFASLAAAAALAAAMPALAQTAPKADAGKPAQTIESKVIPSGVYRKEQGNTEYLAKDRLIGRSVVDKTGHVVGDIEDLIITRDHQIVGVIMGVGGFLGAGEKKVGVRLEALKFEAEGDKVTIRLMQVSKEILTALQPFQRLEAKRSLLQRAKEKARELSDKTRDSDALDKAKAKMHELKEKSGPALEKAKEKAKELGEKAKELGEKGYEKAKELGHQGAEKAKELGEKGAEKAKELGEAAKDAVAKDAAPAPKQ